MTQVSDRPTGPGPEVDPAGPTDVLVALHDLAAVAITDLSEHLHAALQVAVDELHCTRGFVLLGDGMAGRVLAKVGDGTPERVVGSELADTRVQEALERRATVVSVDGNHARGSGVDSSVVPTVVSPLWVDGQAVGALVIELEQAWMHLDPWLAAVADQVADLMARWIEHHADGPVMAGAERRSRQAQVAAGQAAVFESIARNEPVEVSLLRARDLLARQAPEATVCVLTIEGGALALISEDGVHPWTRWFAERSLTLADPYGQCAVTGGAVIVTDVERDRRFERPIVPDPQFEAVAVHAIPSARLGAAIGLLVVLGPATAVTRTPEEVVSSVLSLASVALDRAGEAARLAHQATHDPLTGVGNRAALLDRLELALARARRSGRGVAVLFCDLDDFKAINDQHGHSAGDHVLVEVAARITSAVRPSDTVCRTGGDEFVVVCEDLSDPSQAEHIAARMTQAVESTPIDLEDSALSIGVSVGLAHADPLVDEAERVLRHADLAMYVTKAARRPGLES